MARSRVVNRSSAERSVTGGNARSSVNDSTYQSRTWQWVGRSRVGVAPCSGARCGAREARNALSTARPPTPILPPPPLRRAPWPRGRTAGFPVPRRDAPGARGARCAGTGPRAGAGRRGGIGGRGDRLRAPIPAPPAPVPLLPSYLALQRVRPKVEHVLERDPGLLAQRAGEDVVDDGPGHAVGQAHRLDRGRRQGAQRGGGDAAGHRGAARRRAAARRTRGSRRAAARAVVSRSGRGRGAGARAAGAARVG